MIILAMFNLMILVGSILLIIFSEKIIKYLFEGLNLDKEDKDDN